MGHETKGFASHPENINRNGRPKKGETITDLINKKLDKDAFVQLLIEKAMEGNYSFMTYINDRIDGKPTQKNEVDLIEYPPVVIYEEDHDPID